MTGAQKCAYHLCGQVFWPHHPRQLYCSKKCLHNVCNWRYRHRKPAKYRDQNTRNRRRQQKKKILRWYALARRRRSLTGLLERVEKIRQRQLKTAGDLQQAE